MRWIVSQEGTRQSYAVPVSFHRLGILHQFFADIWCRHGHSVLKRGFAGARALATHYNRELPPDRVTAYNSMAIPNRVWQHFQGPHWSSEARANHYCRYGRWFATRVRDHLSRADLDPERDHFFGFNTNCLETLESLRKWGILTVVDQVDPGIVEEDLVIEETSRWPGWARSPGRAPASYWDRIKAEWNCADLVLVNSEWSKQALIQQGVPTRKLIVVPLAIDLAHGAENAPVNAEGNLQVLWLGSVILRKGIPYLLEAARRLQDHKVEFLLAGPLGISAQAVRSFPPNVKVLGRITRDQLGRVYRQAHVFVLPTLSDGFAVTQLEAMAHGLPVVTTPNCGRVVTDGFDGWIVPARDSAALTEALARFNTNRCQLREMSRNALITVRKYDLPSNARMITEMALEHRRARQGSGPEAESAAASFELSPPIPSEAG